MSSGYSDLFDILDAKQALVAVSWTKLIEINVKLVD